MNKNNLPNNLYELRRRAELSQEELAEKLGVSRQAVSKWERGEAYPDTENLIIISEMFSITIDELLKVDMSEEIPEPTSDTEEGADTHESEGTSHTVRKSVTVNVGGVKIHVDKSGTDEYEDDDDDEDEEEASGKLSLWYALPYTIVVTFAFFAIGLFSGGWYWAWTLFLTIPIYYPLLDAIRSRKASEFPYPTFLVFIYLLFGMLYGAWHPWWIIFLTIPIFDPIAEAIDEMIRRKKD